MLIPETGRPSWKPGISSASVDPLILVAERPYSFLHVRSEKCFGICSLLSMDSTRMGCVLKACCHVEFR